MTKKEIWKIIEYLVVFLLGDLVGAPISAYWINLFFPHPESNLLGNSTVVFLLLYIMPGLIADFIWYKLKNSFKPK